MLQFFKKILKENSSLKPNLSPLRFSESAHAKIQSQLDSRPTGVRSAFKIQLQYEPEKFFVQVGFDEYKSGQSTVFDYPFPILISELDEKMLRGSLIDYLEEEKSFFIYPEIEIEAEDTPKANIIKFFINRLVISEDSSERDLAISYSGFQKENHAYFLDLLFSTGLVESIYMKSNWVQVELLPEKTGRHSEEILVNTLLDYFEKCGYSLLVDKDKISPAYAVPSD